MKMITRTIAASALAASLGPAQASDQEVVEALYSKVLSGTASPDLPARLAAVLSPDWQSLGDYSGTVKTRDQFLDQLQRIGAVAPGMRWKIEEILQVGNRYVVRGRATATPVGSFMGVAPTGRSFDIMAIDIHTVENNRIVRSYHVEDWHGAIQQLQAK
ncbi:ester cyclase [Aquabacterium sp. A7-Y]|uniref:ester cyclase n=1 Tax=Aquabacterium sp. A7-Y TaxID=1349605 RepID=UPI00223D655D|nr:ester cyclase [Aquabacterium sp. A7-Y]MCW7541283.1 ester cyclase [Aquabacterium sp. A7-Y]